MPLQFKALVQISSVSMAVLALFLILGCTVAPSSDPFEIEKKSVYIPCGQDSIFGYLYTPIGIDHEAPAMLLLQGGGDVGLDNYVYEAEFFAKMGMVTLVCDKAGSGKSRGPTNWRGQTFAQKVDEYEKLFKWLQKQEGVNPAKVGVHGMSEGGRLSVALAIQNKEVAFVNSVSGPFETYMENHLFAIEHYMADRGASREESSIGVGLWRQYLIQIGEGTVQQSLIDEVNAFRRKHPNINYLPSNSTRPPERPLPADIHYVVGGDLDSISCPVLFQFGENDALVDAAAAVQIIPKKENFKIIVYENTDHNMTTEEYVHASYDSDKRKWITDTGILQGQ